MICGQDFYSLILMKSSTEFGDGCCRIEQSLRGKGAEGADKVGLDARYLPLQKRVAGIDLIGLGIPVLRRATLDDIADINLTAGQFDGFDNASKKLTGSADKGFSLLVLVKSRSLTDKYKFGLQIPITKDNMLSFLRQPTAPAFT